MAAESGDLSGDSLRGDVQVARDLPISHASSDLGDELEPNVGALLPIGCAESLGAEAFLAGLAEKPLDTLLIGWSPEGSDTFIAPAFIWIVVILTVRVGAVRRGPGFRYVS